MDVITGAFIIDFFSYWVYRLTNPQTIMADVLLGKTRDSWRHADFENWFLQTFGYKKNMTK